MHAVGLVVSVLIVLAAIWLWLYEPPA